MVQGQIEVGGTKQSFQLMLDETKKNTCSFKFSVKEER